MTAAELNLILGGRATFIDRHRPLLLATEIVLLFVGCFFYLTDVLGISEFKISTWGEWAWELPAWFWGALNAIGAAIAAVGLLKPVKNTLIASGAVLHLVQFGAIFQSAWFSGGDKGVAIYAAALALLHAKLVFEAVRWTR